MKYQIEANFEVFEADFKHGQGRFVQCFDISDKFEVESWKEALSMFLENHSLDVYDKTFESEVAFAKETEQNFLQFIFIVDNDNVSATLEEMESWKKGEMILYDLRLTVSIFAMQEINFLNA